MYSCFYCTVQIAGASLASDDVVLTFSNLQEPTNKRMNELPKNIKQYNDKFYATFWYVFPILFSQAVSTF